MKTDALVAKLSRLFHNQPDKEIPVSSKFARQMILNQKMPSGEFQMAFEVRISSNNE